MVIRSTFESLPDQIGLRVGAIQKLGASLHSDHPQLQLLVESMQTFTRDYLAYIDLVGAEDRHNRMSTAMSRIQEEWANISRAYEQRQVEFYKNKLDAAEKQAQTYYRRFHGDRYTQVPVVYFEKLFAISRFLFTPHALISFPIQFHDPEVNQWHALAHELGHHIYWNSLEFDEYEPVHKRLRNALLQTLAPTRDRYEQFLIESKLFEVWSFWLEETFADIAGTLMAGVSYAQSAQQTALQFLPGRMLETPTGKGDFAEHPSPLIRPLIALETLKWVSGQPSTSQGSSAALEVEIAGLQGRWNTITNLLSNHYTIQDVGIVRIMETIPNVVRTILNFPWGLSSRKLTPRAMGQFFDCSEWVQTLSAGEVENELSLDRIEVQTDPAPADMFVLPAPPASGSFRDVFDWVQAQTLDKAARKGISLQGAALHRAVLDALLDLDLAVEWQGNCNMTLNSRQVCTKC
ncbi:MAG: hypothetical protein JNM70_14660 [Anaerolineae bacterium]|nr:hypothetical protein [Anaerolineae bacterium]